MTDIAPELLEAVKKSFEAKTKGLGESITKGVKNYEEAYRYAIKVGGALAGAFKTNITSEILPDGMMYFNIANRVVLPMLQAGYELSSAAAVQAQKSVNKAAGIGMKPQVAEFDEDKAKGIIDRLSSEPFEDVKWILDDPVKTFSKNAVDETLEKNVEFQGKSGLHPKIVRTASANACPWCLEMEGEYEYPDVPKDVYRRHENCDCTVEYVDGGKRQDVWSKKERYEGDDFSPQELVQKIKDKVEEARERKDIAEQLKGIGFKSVDKNFLLKADKELQAETTSQLRDLEDKFGAVKKGDISIELKKGPGASTRVNKTTSESKILKFGQDTFGSRDQYLKQMRQDINDGWAMPCNMDDDILSRYIVTHEYGHILENALIKEELGVKMGTRADFARYYRNQIENIARQFDPNYSPEKYISGYVQEVRVNKPGEYDTEFFAECFANSQLGEPNVLGQAMNQWLESRGYQ